jgi:hypothetical protein
MESPQIADWIRTVHDALVPSAVEQSGARWGPIRLRHRTVRSAWFGNYDRAWANPVDRPVHSPDGDELVGIDLVTAALADLPNDIEPPAITLGELGARGEVVSTIDEGVALVWGIHSGEILGWDRASGKAICVRLEPPDGYETVSPLRSLVHWATIAGGGVLLHGATVGRHRRPDPGSEPESTSVNGLLLVGEAGYGKSTSTLACIERGWVTSGDDAVAIFPDEQGWNAASVYAAVKTKIDTPQPDDSRFARRTDAGIVTWTIAGRKRAHLLTSTDSELLVDSIRLAGIVVLDPETDDNAPWRSITAAAARNAAAPSSALPLPYHRAEILERIGALARSLPCFSLPRRTDLETTVADLGDILVSSEPDVSVIIPVFEGEHFIDDALASVAGQTIGRLQIIIVSDASPDDSIARAEAWRARLEGLGHSLIVIGHDTNQGVAQARNTGIAASTADLIAFLDQDDLWTDDHLALLHTGLARTGADVSLGGVTFVDLGSEADRPWIRDEWFAQDHAGHVLGAILMRRSVFDRLGTLDPNQSGIDDLDWLMRLRDSDVSVVETGIIVLKRRIHDTNQSRNVSRPAEKLLAAVRDHLGRTR